MNGLFYLKQGSFLIIHNESKRIYIGEVLDLYKLAAGNRYSSMKRANGVEELKYLSVHVYLPLIAVGQSDLQLKLTLGNSSATKC